MWFQLSPKWLSIAGHLSQISRRTVGVGDDTLVSAGFFSFCSARWRPLHISYKLDSSSWRCQRFRRTDINFRSRGRVGVTTLWIPVGVESADPPSEGSLEPRDETRRHRDLSKLNHYLSSIDRGSTGCQSLQPSPARLCFLLPVPRPVIRTDGRIVVYN